MTRPTCALTSLILAAAAVAFGQTPPRAQFVGLLSKVAPIYPAAARQKRIQGAVWLDAVIGKDGHVTGVDTIRGNPALIGAAKDAVKQWIYTPTLLNGEPIEVIYRVCVPFLLHPSSHAPSPCPSPRRVRIGYPASPTPQTEPRA